MLQTQNRSTFVTTVAWTFIVISGFSTVISLLQNVMFFTLFDDPEVSQALQTSPPPDMSPVLVFMLNHIHIFIVAFLVVSMFTCISAIGLLKRWNPARLCFIGIMGLGILWNLGGLALQFSIFSSIQEQFSAGSPSDAHVAFVIVVVIMTALFAIGFSILFGWIAKRLLSPEIVAEFQR